MTYSASLFRLISLEINRTIWNASRAKLHLPEIIDAAVSGTPQFIGRRDGKDVVVVSKEYFERTRPNLKPFLLENTYSGDGEDEFDQILRDIRNEGFDVLSRSPAPNKE